ncbi:MAG: DUF86 domain-containing protein [bacterium]
MIFSKVQRENIVQRIDFIRLQLADLQELGGLNWQTYNTDRHAQRDIERLIENVANAAIDIAKIVLVGEDIEMPNGYKDIILKLGQAGVLDDKLARTMSEYAMLRNFLAHQYLDLKWEKIKDFIKNAPVVVAGYIEAVKNKLG